MNCHYCHQPCTLIAYSIVAETIPWECQNGCNATFRLLRDGSPVSITWKGVKIKGRNYWIKIYDGVTGNAPEFTVSCYASIEHNMHGIYYWKEIIRWDFIPDWTPQNAAEHLSNYLAFL